MEFIKNLFNPKKNQNSDSIQTCTTEDIKNLLSKDKLDASKLPALLEMRSRKKVSFILVDVREVDEYNSCSARRRMDSIISKTSFALPLFWLGSSAIRAPAFNTKS